MLVCSLLTPQNIQAQPRSLETLDAYVEQALSDWGVPGVALGILKQGEVVHARGYGVQKKGENTPVDTETLFAIGSNTKAFTATGLGLLIAEEKLDWDDRVVDHLDGFQLYDPYMTREMRVRDLLCHRSGYGVWEGDLVFWGSNYTREEIVSRMRFLKPAHSFRSTYAYSNQMFILAGSVLEALSGVSWEAFINDRIFAPLGMNRSLPGAAGLDQHSNVASPHTRIDGEIIPITHRPIDNAAPAGAIYSTVNDLFSWLQFQLDDGQFDDRVLLAEEILRETHTPQMYRGSYPISESPHSKGHFQSYGLGWGISDYAGRVVISHTGGVDGFFSLTGIVPEEDLGIIILTNDDQNAVHRALFNRILDAYLGEPETDWSTLYLENRRNAPELERPQQQGTSPGLNLASYAGTYKNDHYGLAQVAFDDENGLTIHLMAHDGLKGPLAHWHHDTFEATWADPYWRTSLVHFAIDESGAGTASFAVKVREDFIDPLSYEFMRID